MKYLFAGGSSVLFSVIVMLVIPQPYALLVCAIGSVVVGWFSGDVYRILLGDK